jgi:hypothetical protein
LESQNQEKDALIEDYMTKCHSAEVKVDKLTFQLGEREDRALKMDEEIAVLKEELTKMDLLKQITLQQETKIVTLQGELKILGQVRQAHADAQKKVQ